MHYARVSAHIGLKRITIRASASKRSRLEATPGITSSHLR